MSSSSETKNQNREVQEESGWTYYLEDFSVAQKTDSSDDHHSIINRSPSLVSDAASYAAPSFGTSLHPSEFPTRLNFIKASPFRNKRISYNEDLEDTASSPVNSPKVGSGKQQLTKNQSRQKDAFGNSMGMEYDGSCLDDLGLHTTTVTGKSENDYTNEESKLTDFNHSELRRKGLCLAPVSMLVNHYLNNSSS